MSVEHLINIILVTGILVITGIVRIKYIPRLFSPTPKGMALSLWLEVVITVAVLGFSVLIVYGIEIATNALVIAIGSGYPITVALDRVSDLIEGWKVQNMAEQAEGKLKGWMHEQQGGNR